ncbi:MAG: hypothetical protein M3O50_08480 [Myxococcota bacterium]|nr:hypothetical protein [Myxococcota bacterium]
MRFVSGFALLAVLGASPGALAANPRGDGSAQDVLRRAANDYLAMNYARAAAQLDQALRTCGATQCAPATRAALWRDLGTMQFRMGDRGFAIKSFAAAVALSPQLELNPDYDTVDLRALWAEVQRGASAPTGDFDHNAPTRQRTNTPLPLYVAGVGADIARVVVKYQPAGASDWKSVNLARLGAGWGGLIPCSDVRAGSLRYYIQGFTAGLDPAGASGDARRPYIVAVGDDVTDEALHLPGAKPPATCDRGRGEAVAGDRGDAEPAASTSSDADVPEFTKGVTVRAEPNGPRIWVGAAATIDFMSPPSGDDLCHLDPRTAGPGNTANVYCVTADGADFPLRDDGGAQNAALAPGRAGHSGGDVVSGGVRLMVALDVAVNANWIAGLRVGAVFGEYPGHAAVRDGFAPGASYHVEGRVSWILGDHPLHRAGVAPVFFVGGGVSEFDEHASSAATVNAYRDPRGANHPAQTRPVDLWVTNGPAFVVAGVGLRYAPLRRVAITAAVRGAESFGKNGIIPAVGPELTVQYGIW